MNIPLLDFQEEYVGKLVDELSYAKDTAKKRTVAVSLAAPTGSGKTVMMAALIERIMFGVDGVLNATPDTVFLWLSDLPELNKQSMNRIKAASSLKPFQFVLVDEKFDAPAFDGGKIYFLNTQKLGKNTLLTKKGDGRKYTIWETIEATVALDPTKFILVVDEAHRGMNKKKEQEQEDKTIVQKFLLGSAGELLNPVPLVIGVTATPERFLNLVKGNGRISLEVNVDTAKVRTSGLLKDNLTVRLPADSNPSDMTLLKAASARWKVMSEEWAKYCAEQGMTDTVRPALVIQVEDGTKNAEGKELLSTTTNLSNVIAYIEEGIGRQIDDAEIAHCMNTESDISVGPRKIRRIEPSLVQASDSINFVVFKMALTTGWDCPRAEVMMSFRKAQDATYIAQLVGRMVRTPLARTIEGNEVLNEAHLYLPHYDADAVEAVLSKLKSDPDNVPAVNVRKESEIDTLAIPPVFEPLRVFLNSQKLPTYSQTSPRKISNVRRLMKFAALLVVDAIDKVALENVRSRIVRYLSEYADNLYKNDEQFKKALTALDTIKMKTIRVNQQTLEYEEAEMEIIDISEKNMDDLFRQASQRLNEDLVSAYRDARYDKDEPYRCKTEIFLLAHRTEVLNNVEYLAEMISDELWDANKGGISRKPSSRQQKYAELRAQAKSAKNTDLIIPQQASFPYSKEMPVYKKHLFQNECGDFFAKLNPWEAVSLSKEMPSAFAWLRNIDRKRWSLAFKYQSSAGDIPGFPDLLVVRKDTKDKFVVDILEPHNQNLGDAPEKAKGLATFAKDHGALFGRVEMQKIEDDGTLVALDFNNNSALQREALAMDATKANLDMIYKKYGNRR